MKVKIDNNNLEIRKYLLPFFSTPKIQVLMTIAKKQ